MNYPRLTFTKNLDFPLNDFSKVSASPLHYKRRGSDYEYYNVKKV